MSDVMPLIEDDSLLGRLGLAAKNVGLTAGELPNWWKEEEGHQEAISYLAYWMPKRPCYSWWIYLGSKADIASRSRILSLPQSYDIHSIIGFGNDMKQWVMNLIVQKTVSIIGGFLPRIIVPTRATLGDLFSIAAKALDISPNRIHYPEEIDIRKIPDVECMRYVETFEEFEELTPRCLLGVVAEWAWNYSPTKTIKLKAMALDSEW